MDNDSRNDNASPMPSRSAIYFDGTSSRRHAVTLAFHDQLEINADDQTFAIWSYADIRRAESPSGTLRQTAGLDTSVQIAVLATPVPNAFALPGGKIYLLNGLLARAQNPDEIAGVLAHELGHLKHRDSTRNLIYNGGTSFLIGLLFGDVTGSSALLFASRTMFEVSYTRDAEAAADRFSIDVMHKLGRTA